MAKERLSRIQKWILKTAYERASKSIRKQEIYKDYFGHSCYWEKFYEFDKKEGWYKKRVSHRVILCRSLKTLEQRKLIKIDRWRGKSADVSLTDEGEKKALMLTSSHGESNSLMLMSSHGKKLTLRKREVKSA